MFIDSNNQTAQELERVATNTINEAHELARIANDVISATCAQALATVGLAQATLANSAWNLYISENRHYDNKR